MADIHLDFLSKYGLSWYDFIDREFNVNSLGPSDAYMRQ